jgi:flagellar biosynthetic protein FliQ
MSAMDDADIAVLVRDGMLVMLKLGGPPLLAALVVGLLVALLQAVTQINEATLAFVPKVLALCAALVLLGPFMMATLSGYTHTLFDRLIAIGGS